METCFFGSFNKQKNLVEWQELNKTYGYEYEVDTTIYRKVAKKIISVLEVKEKYTVQDAVRFFREYYFAYPIRLTDFYDHVGTEYIFQTENDKSKYAVKCDNDIDGLNKGVGYGGQYCYIADTEGKPSQEKSVTLVIPTSYNKELWDMYPEYLEKIKTLSVEYNKDLERRKEFSKISPVSAAKNIILVIGSFDCSTINSMKVVLGENQLQEIEYALEFFRLHS